MSKHIRGRLYIDKDVQRALVWQLVRHWLLFVVILSSLLVALEGLNPQQPRSLGECLRATWEQHGPLFLMIVVLMPVFAYDSIKLSHRFVGPVIRVRRAILEASRGQRVLPLNFRKTDFWQDMASDFNTLLERLPENSAKGFPGNPPPNERALAASGVASGDDAAES